MRRRVIKIGSGLLASVAVVFVAGCVSFSPFMIREAALPEDWPELTPVGETRIQTYPESRAATVTAEQAGGGMGEMHGVLFKHIKSEGIPMTAPVGMGYEAENVASGPTRMAFMYRSPQQGSTGLVGNVQVLDVKSGAFASLGVRGGYSADWISSQVAKLRAWLEAQDQWRAIGPPRYLGYNSPFVPAFLRYGEVQIPVEQAGAGATGESSNED
jgi:hypothetical protein